MEYTLYLKLQFAKSKKPISPSKIRLKQKKTKKTDFVETYLLNLLNSYILLLRVLKIFLFPFMFCPTFRQVTKRNIGPTDNFQARGGQDILKDLAL